MRILVTLCALLTYLHTAAAGEFSTSNYGHVNVKAFEDLVTQEFTTRFAANTWSIFVYSDAFSMDRSEQAICHAIVGVVPKGSHQFPLRQFSMTKTATVKRNRWTEAEALDFETECVRAAVDRMMSTNPAQAYRAY